ncbi:MAG: hypothetical protein ACTSRV_10045 [Candidatus Freyarchaeota archaeon]
MVEHCLEKECFYCFFCEFGALKWKESDESHITFDKGERVQKFD